MEWWGAKSRKKMKVRGRRDKKNGNLSKCRSVVTFKDPLCSSSPHPLQALVLPSCVATSSHVSALRVNDWQHWLVPNYCPQQWPPGGFPVRLQAPFSFFFLFPSSSSSSLSSPCLCLCLSFVGVGFPFKFTFTHHPGWQLFIFKIVT